MEQISFGNLTPEERKEAEDFDNQIISKLTGLTPFQIDKLRTEN